MSTARSETEVIRSETDPPTEREECVNVSIEPQQGEIAPGGEQIVTFKFSPFELVEFTHWFRCQLVQKKSNVHVHVFVYLPIHMSLVHVHVFVYLPIHTCTCTCVCLLCMYMYLYTYPFLLHVHVCLLYLYRISSLSPSVAPLDICVSGSSVLPYCHFDIPESDYLTNRRPSNAKGVMLLNSGSTGSIEPSTKIIEFNSTGTGHKITR